MKQLKMILLLLVSSMVFTGCFNMVEEVTHNSKKGTGTYKFVIDMSGMKMMMEMASAMDTTGQANPLDTLSQVSKEFSGKVSGLSGISNVREISDMDNLTFGVEFDYKNIPSLNVAVGQLFEGSDPLASGDKMEFFRAKGKKFERLNAGGFSNLVDEMMGGMGAGGEDDQMGMAMMLLKDVSYKTIFHFDKKIKKASNELAKISSDKKTVELKYFMFDEDRGGSNASIENKIKLKGGWFW